MSRNQRINYFLIYFFHSLYNRTRSLLPVALAIVITGLAARFAYYVFHRSSFVALWDMDFFGIWSYAKFVVVNGASQIYDNERLLDFQMELGAAPRAILPYAHPPSFLMMILPLGLLPYRWAFAAWDLVTFFCYFFASFYRRWRLSAVLLTIFAPATLQNLFTGQTGFLSAALIVGGFRLVQSQPILGGALLGLATFKPQLGILIPVALISARLWRPIASAVAVVVLLVSISSLAFGWSIWPAWLEKLPAQAEFVVNVPDLFKPTITANLTFIGVDLAAARMVQACVAVLVAIVTLVCFQRGVNLLATAALLVGTFLATPHAFIYDMPMLTNAVLMFIRHKDQNDRCLTISEATILFLALVVPILMTETWRLSMFRMIPLLLLFGLLVRDLLRRDTQ
jgi:hypothetical protein